MNPDWIAPSILAADFARLGDEAAAVVAGGADAIHFDVMDNHYVPNLTIGPPVCASLRRFLDAAGLDVPIDAHLMVEPVEELLPRFAEAGARYISFHPEASRDVGAAIAAIREAGCQPGLVFNPDVALTGLEDFVDSVDLVLIMSVFPGFGGQSFIDSVVPKIAEARALIDSSGSRARLEVDGGITLDNIGTVAAAGADTFVAGSAIYGSDDYTATITAMRREIERARGG